MLIANIAGRGRSGIDMRVLSQQLPEVDLWGARCRAAFFEEVFGTQLSILWQAVAAAAPVGRAARG